MTPQPLPKIDADLADLLDREAERINVPEFADADPVQFPRRFDALPDIEIAALLSATIAWGNRKMICRDCERLLDLMDHAPAAYLLDEGYEELPDDLNIHRTFFCRNLKALMRALRPLYERHGSMQEWARSLAIGTSDTPAWELARALGQRLRDANNGCHDSRCLPQNVDSTALKRINMMLRWLVRRDGIVDLGVWDIITPAQLYIPLDVHVAATARQLGLLNRRSNDRTAVHQLTDTLRTLRPTDPTIYDYALFGIGMNL